MIEGLNIETRFQKKSKYEAIAIVGAIIVFRLLLDYLYCEVISPMYFYAGLIVSFNKIGLFVSWIMLGIYIYLFLKLVKYNTCGAIVIGTLLLCSAIPTTIVPAYIYMNWEFVLLNVIYWFFLVTIYKSKGIKFSVNKLFFIKVKKSPYTVNAIFVVFAMVILFIIIKYTGVHVSFDLSNVYETRAAFEVYAMPTIITYMFSASIIVFPICLVYALNEKKYLLAFWAALFQILVFSIDGRKSTLFVLIITLICHFFVNKLSVKFMAYAVTGVTFIGFMEEKILGSTLLDNYFVRRLFLLPAYLQYAYYDYFKDMPKDIFRQSIIGRFGFQSPYVEKIQRIVGNNYYMGSYANNGLFADAYFNLGIIGVFIMPLMICLAIKILEGASKGLDIGCYVGLLFVSCYTLLSSSFFVVMLTHGFLLGCIIIYFIPRKKVTRFYINIIN